MPTINKMMGIGSFGFTAGYAALPDQWRWRFMQYSFSTQTPPPRGSTLRVSRHENAYFHFGKETTMIKQDGNEVETGDANNIVSTNGVSQRVDDISASTDSTEVVDGQEAYNKGFTDGSTTGVSDDSTEQKGLPVVVAGGNGTDAVSEQLYASG